MITGTVHIVWRHAHSTDGSTEPANDLIKRARCVTFNIPWPRNHQIKSLFYADTPN
jgi:hypothetical protein